MSNLHFLVTAAVIFLVSTHLYEASGRVLNGYDLVLQSVQKGEPTPPSEHNGCTNIPGSNGPPCTNQKAFAGRLATEYYFIDLVVSSNMTMKLMGTFRMAD
ncbi:hypothetical protein Gotri_027511 [Gossypium trilobum]|uniref:Uncharacterized protein n=1 Tax=Gossypium trilobum TaxID=34281 RepID=A0A7J9FS24_9ROSI|nr:hypothetical protein [Gossypium trilobum]